MSEPLDLDELERQTRQDIYGTRQKCLALITELREARKFHAHHCKLIPELREARKARRSHDALVEALEHLVAIIDSDAMKGVESMAYIHGYRVDPKVSKRHGAWVAEARELLADSVLDHIGDM